MWGGTVHRTIFYNLPCCPGERQNGLRMPAITQKGPRGPRVKLGGSILALVLLENGRQVRGRMNQLSVNGGVGSLAQPLDAGIRGTVVFHLWGTSIPCRGAMLFPSGGSTGSLQPFR